MGAQGIIERWNKHSNRHSPTLYMKALPDNAFCPVQSLHNFLKLRGPTPGYLFVHEKGNVLTRQDFTDIFRSAIKQAGLLYRHLTPHSLRIGGTVHAFNKGFSETQIQELGRWKSHAFLKYLRQHKVIIN